MVDKKVWLFLLFLFEVNIIYSLKIDLLEGLNYKIEVQNSVSDSKTPLWMNANKYGLSSLDKANGYLRTAIARRIATDSLQKFDVGYGFDVVGAYNYSSKGIVQQAYVEGRWLSANLLIGSKEIPMELKNQDLSSGSQTFGINARPIPQIRLSLPEYWTIPYTKGWVQLKGHLAFGFVTDDQFQKEFTSLNSSYTENTLYHSKAGYIKIGKSPNCTPWSIELGLEMACQFAGTSYAFLDKSGATKIEHSSGFNSFVHAFIPFGGEVTEDVYKNAKGNHLGSWIIRVNYDTEDWGVSTYADHFFEDHSAMYFLGKYGYGKDDNWEKRDNSVFLYDFKDIMLGVELRLNKCSWLKNMVLEYIYSKYQSGPIYHEHGEVLYDQISGMDDYYNHFLYSGWQHWGQVMGNPLYRSPIYNENGSLRCLNNRFCAVHVGLNGNPWKNLHYKVLATYQNSLGTYKEPYLRPQDNWYFLVETGYLFDRKLEGWSLKGGFGLDLGRTLGYNKGFQITIAKSGVFRK